MYPACRALPLEICFTLQYSYLSDQPSSSQDGGEKRRKKQYADGRGPSMEVGVLSLLAQRNPSPLIGNNFKNHASTKRYPTDFRYYIQLIFFSTATCTSFFFTTISTFYLRPLRRMRDGGIHILKSGVRRSYTLGRCIFP